MQRICDFDFYEHDENIPIPSSFKHIASQDDETYYIRISHLWPVNPVEIRAIFQSAWLGNKENLEFRR